MHLKWEFLGKQEHSDREEGKRGGHIYLSLLWRTPVPGGWLLMTLNARSSDPIPMVSFYPDPDHHWTTVSDPQADYLLRPAAGGAETASRHLLRPGQSPDPENAEN
jgi:hypothetical protein